MKGDTEWKCARVPVSVAWMSDPVIIDQALLDQVTTQAQSAPRRRKNLNFHASDGDASHRLLNAVEPSSYVAPHRHGHPTKDESIIALRGRFGILLFDDGGRVTRTAILEPGGAAVAANIPHGVFHAIVALAPGSVFFEAKAGPFVPLAPAEKAPWAPAEGDARVPEYLEWMKQTVVRGEGQPAPRSGAPIAS